MPMLRQPNSTECEAIVETEEAGHTIREVAAEFGFPADLVSAALELRDVYG